MMNYTEECCMGYAKHETHDLVTGMLSLIIVSLKLSSQELLSWNKKWEYSRLSTLRMVWGWHEVQQCQEAINRLCTGDTKIHSCSMTLVLWICWIS